MQFIEKTDCKLSVSKWQCKHLQNKIHLSTFVTFFCWLIALPVMIWNLM